MYNLSGKLDIVGLPGFSHNFGALDGKHAGVMEVFDTFGAPSAPRQSMQASSSWRRSARSSRDEQISSESSLLQWKKY